MTTRSSMDDDTENSMAHLAIENNMQASEGTLFTLQSFCNKHLSIILPCILVSTQTNEMVHSTLK